MGLTVGVLQVACVGVEGEGGEVIFCDIFEVHVLLYFHEPADAFLIHDVLVDKVGEELKVQLDHFEVYESSF